ncbi:hypothetical protein [Levilactobacillus bambusae]|uniref:Uncharacterized protein n=1 Tax=Levilactobacillus bambusae TaxID=2024736 RepID=A0A2V1N5X3_9LACO|nr:hypothetical protein [Levilactobacillus bambusae]PWG00980.1 hypothetical protein DCM90_02050 [Levilactobacillus bambusae]
MQSVVTFEAQVPEVFRQMIDNEAVKQKTLAEEMHYTPARISQWLRVDKPAGLKEKDFLNLLDQFKHPMMLVVAYMNQTTHLIPPLANGPRLRHEPDTYASQIIDELEESVDSLKGAMDELRSNDEIDSRDVVNAVNQVLDVMFFAFSWIAMIDGDPKYQVDAQFLEQEREKTWTMAKYMER